MEIFTTSEIILGLDCVSPTLTLSVQCDDRKCRSMYVWMYLSEHTQLPHYQEISIIMGDEIFACFQSIFNMFHSKVTFTLSQDLKIIYETYLGSSSVSDDWSFWCPEDPSSLLHCHTAALKSNWWFCCCWLLWFPQITMWFPCSCCATVNTVNSANSLYLCNPCKIMAMDLRILCPDTKISKRLCSRPLFATIYMVPFLISQDPVTQVAGVIYLYIHCMRTRAAHRFDNCS